MRIFVLGVGATGSLVATLLARRGYRVVCGDRDPERAARFLGPRAAMPVRMVNARDMWNIVKAARGAHLLINTCPSVVNKIALRAALRLRCHYLDTAAHLSGRPGRVEQLAFTERFATKRRSALITAGVAPGLTNLLVAAAADDLDEVEFVKIRLYESTESTDPVSQWSAEVSYQEAVARPWIYRDGRFALGPRFGEREPFQFPQPIGRVGVVLAAQDEVATIPQVIPLRAMDAKIGGSDMERLRRWYRQGRLRKSRGLSTRLFPRTPTPGTVDRLFHGGVLHNARFAAAVLVEGRVGARRVRIRWDAAFPTLFQLLRRGQPHPPIAWATAHMAALFVAHFPRDLIGVHPPEALPADIRSVLLRGARRQGIRLVRRVTAARTAC